MTDHYPRIVTCRVTGVKQIVRTPAEEREVHRAILPAVLFFGAVAFAASFALAGFAVYVWWRGS